MAEQKQPLVLALGRGYNGFYCPETRFHLVGGIKPQAVYPLEVLSEDVKRALRGGTLVDVNQVLSPEDIKPSKSFQPYTSSADRKKQIVIQAEEVLKEKIDIGEKEYVDNFVSPDFKGQEVIALSEADILSSTKAELQKFIDEHEELSYEILGLSSNAKKDDIQEALLKYYGYDQKPEDFKEE